MSNHHLSNRKSSSIEWCDLGTVGIGVLKSFSDDSWIDKRYDTSEGGGGWESGVGADGRNIDHEWVEVLLSCDKTASGGNSSIAGAKLGDDEIGLGEFTAGVGGSEKELDGSSSEGCSLTRSSEISESPDGRDSSIALLLSKTSFSDSRKKRDEKGLGIHDENLDCWILIFKLDGEDYALKGWTGRNAKVL
jgi:hypothetical protein